VAQKFSVVESKSATPKRRGMEMAKIAKFGVFSPAVYAFKITIGEKSLFKVRGKAISLHSGYIGDFCQWSGASHLRTKLIKLAKENGNTLGFLV